MFQDALINKYILVASQPPSLCLSFNLHVCLTLEYQNGASTGVDIICVFYKKNVSEILD